MPVSYPIDRRIAQRSQRLWAISPSPGRNAGCWPRGHSWDTVFERRRNNRAGGLFLRCVAKALLRASIEAVAAVKATSSSVINEVMRHQVITDVALALLLPFASLLQFASLCP